MKKIVFLFLLSFSLAMIHSCEDGIPGTEDLNYVTFEAPVVDLGVDIGGSNEREVKIYTTMVTGSDRTFKIKVIPESTTASEEAYSIPSTVTVPANTNSGVIKVNLNDVNIGDGKKIGLDIEPEEGLFKGRTTTLNISRICNQNDVRLNLVFDGYASECTWNLKDNAGEIIASGGPYKDGDKTASAKFCLEDGTYTFTIFDQYGDGLSYPTNGSATVSKGTTQLVYIEGDFGDSESVTFSVSMN
jgi:hypothetical protein